MIKNLVLKKRERERAHVLPFTAGLKHSAEKSAQTLSEQLPGFSQTGLTCVTSIHLKKQGTWGLHPHSRLTSSFLRGEQVPWFLPSLVWNLKDMESYWPHPHAWFLSLSDVSFIHDIDHRVFTAPVLNIRESPERLTNPQAKRLRARACDQ